MVPMTAALTTQAVPPKIPLPKIMVVLNPNAGRGRGSRIKDQLARALQREGIGFDIAETRAQGDGIALAADARRNGCEIVMAVGGDGTINDVVNGLAQVAIGDGLVGDSLMGDGLVGKLALCPIGTGNDLASMLGYPLNDIDALARRMAAGKTRRIDLGCATLTSPTAQLTRYFDNNIGIGFEAQVTLESYRMKRIPGALRYLVAVIKALRRFHLPSVELRWETPMGEWQQYNARALMISVGNSPRTGGLFYVTPDALMDDGLFDLGVVQQVSRGQILWLLPKVMKGSHRDEPVVMLTRCRRLHFRCTETMPVHLDGEVVMRDMQEAQVEIHAGRLEVIV